MWPEKIPDGVRVWIKGIGWGITVGIGRYDRMDRFYVAPTYCGRAILDGDSRDSWFYYVPINVYDVEEED